MSVAPGARLGPYEITARLGEGGMGEVWRATDTKLRRDVAIKVLPAAFTEDKERLARFEREAQLLAQLHHPNIASIFGLEESGGIRALVMELVEGPTLAERIASGPLEVGDCVAIARQIAVALEEAHEKGIVHRDLKPANVKVDDENRVKVLDFGLAKAMSAESGIGSAASLANSPTLTQGATVEGVILGTAAYMSPEQAKGKAVDKRADVWAFGVVLFEMLVGRKLFDAETLPETLGAIFRQEIDLDELPAATPSRLRRLVERCLERDPKRRLRDIGEARIALEAIASGEADPAPGATPEAGRRAISLPFLVALVTGVAAISGLAVWSALRSPAGGATVAAPVIEFALEVDSVSTVVLSPDGQRLAWITRARGGSNRALWVRDLDSRVPRRIVDDPDLGRVFWSPDGSALAVGIGEKLWRYPVAGGEGVPICDFPKLEGVPSSFAIAGAWLPDGTILFASWRGGIFRVPARGGVPELLIPIDPEADVDFHEILALPDGKSLLLAAHRQEGVQHADVQSGFRIELYRDGRRSPVGGGEEPLGDVAPIGFAKGILLAALRDENERSIWGIPFDAERGTLTGRKFVVFPRLDDVSLAADGTLAYVPPQALPAIVARVDRNGAETGTLGESRVGLAQPALSADGSRLAFTLDDNELWVEDLRRGTRTRLVQEDGDIGGPQWSSDGRTLYYSAVGRSRSLRRVRADPGAAPETVLDDVFQAVVAPDGSGILFAKGSFRLETGQGLYWAPLDGTGSVGESKKVLEGIGTFGSLSPDGKLLAYRRVVGLRSDAFVTTFPALDQTIQLSSNGGDEPQWSPDGRSVFYRSEGELIEVEVGLDARGTLTASSERRLFDARRAGLRLGDWTVAPDGKGFLFVKTLASDERSEIVVVRNGLQRALAEAR